MNRILITGATGFIGSHVLEALAEAGHSLVVLARPESNTALALKLGAEVRCGDITDPASLPAAFRGCSQLVHVAGRSSDWGSWQEFHSANVDGTLNVLAAALNAGIRHAVVTGSISSYGEENCLRLKDEHSPFNSHYPYFLHRIFPSAFNYYRDSKAQGTRVATEFARDHGLNLTILEPAWVFGEREAHTGFLAYLKTVQSGCRWMPGSRANDFHVVYARDLARAYVLACEARLAGIHRFIIANPAPEPMHRVFGCFCEAAGLKSPRPLPKALAYPVGFFLELGCSVVRGRNAPPLTRGRVNMFYDSIRFSPALAAQQLGFHCQYSLEDAVKCTVAWYRANHWI